MVTAPDNTGSAHCALWWNETPAYEHEHVGLIGDYTATNAAAAHELLHLACAWLAAEGCSLAVGPLDGSTWGRYRLVVEAGDEPPFFMEPHNPPAYPHQFRAAGFAPLACYTSSLVPDLAQIPPLGDGAQIRSRLMAQGIRLRQVTPAEIADTCRFCDLLCQVYPVVCAAFANNVFFQPITVETFCANYLPLRPMLRPDLLWLAEHAGRVVGFLLALPDVAQAQAGRPVDTVILKTLAVLPAYTRRGIGALLCDLCQRHAAAQGFRRAIHALMPATTHSHRISQAYTHVMRRYVLFGRTLGVGTTYNSIATELIETGTSHRPADRAASESA
jgi:GNAT superfamily N-acetyltransferase